MVVAQVMWLLSGKVSEDIFRKQLERIVGAVATNLQQQQQGGMPRVVTCMLPVSGCSLLSSPKVSILPRCLLSGIASGAQDRLVSRISFACAQLTYNAVWQT